MSSEATTALPPATARGDRSPSLASWLVLTIWWGLTTGLLEAGLAILKRVLRPQQLFYNEHFVWMTPAAEAFFFLALGFPLLLVGYCLSPSRRMQLWVGGLTGLAAFVVVTSTGYIYVWAAGLLALGVAWRSGDWARHAVPSTTRFFRRSLWIPLTLFAAAIVGVFAKQVWDDRQQRPPGPSPHQGPNVLLVILDTVRADSLSVYGAPAGQTPFLGQLADQAVVFDAAMAPSSWTLPSHASMFTGRDPKHLSAGWYQALDNQHPTLAEVMRDAGYATGGFVANTTYCARTTGLRRGFETYQDFTFSFGEVIRHAMLWKLADKLTDGRVALGFDDDPGRKHARQVTDDFLDWVDQQPDRPFFAFLNYFDAHAPYLPDRLPNQRRALTRQERILLRRLVHADSDDLKQHADFSKDCYLAVVHELDNEMRRLHGELQRRKLADNTILMITSDHGEHFGEHDIYYHGNGLYRPAINVPLIVSWPSGLPESGRVAPPASLTDLPATIVRLTGVDDRQLIPGRLLFPVAGQAPPERGPAFFSLEPGPRASRFLKAPIAKGPMSGCLTDQIYLIREGDGHELGFDFQNDPREQHNLVGGLHHLSRALQQAQQALNQWLQGAPAPETDAR